MRKIGTIKHNGTLVAVDPCYNVHESKFCGKHLNLPKGEYDVYIQETRCDLVGGIVLIEKGVKVSAINKAVHPNDSYWCGVDAGCVMLADKTYYNNTHNDNGADDSWYNNEVVAHAYDNYHFPNNECVIVSSGNGDGSYPVYELYIDHHIVGCCVKFLDFGKGFFEVRTGLSYILK